MKQYEFGYFPRNKYKDLVFYVKTGEHSNLGLFEMEDTEENRAIMDALLHPYHSEREKVLDELRIKYVEFLDHPCPGLADKYEHCCDSRWCGLCTLDEVLEELRQKAGES
jgi:hypothetical protein